MRYPSWFSYLILFSIFFPIGFWTGSQLSPLNRNLIPAIQFRPLSFQTQGRVYPLPSDPNSHQQTDNQIFRGDSTQINTLILFVDDLTAEKLSLISAWLLIQPKDTSRLIFVPIFQEDNPDHELTSTFQIDRKQLGKRFVNTLATRNLLWHDYLILDQAAQKQLLASANPPPDTGFISSNLVFEWVCKGLPQNPESMNQLKLLIPDHIFANFDLETSVGIWQRRLLAEPHLLCEFPTFLQ